MVGEVEENCRNRAIRKRLCYSISLYSSDEDDRVRYGSAHSTELSIVEQSQSQAIEQVSVVR